MAKDKFINPFDVGVNYKDFLEAAKASKLSVKEYCKGKLNTDQIEWLENDLKNYKQ